MQLFSKELYMVRMSRKLMAFNTLDIDTSAVREISLQLWTIALNFCHKVE